MRSTHIVMLLLVGLPAFPARSDETLDGLRTSQAKHYFSPDAHLALAAEAVDRYPKDSHLGVLLATLAYQRHEDAAAEREFVEAARLAPESANVQGRVGRFFLKGRNQPDRALEYYLRAYFLDPEFYDGEYAEGRIRTIPRRRRDAEVERDETHRRPRRPVD